MSNVFSPSLREARSATKQSTPTSQWIAALTMFARNDAMTGDVL